MDVITYALAKKMGGGGGESITYTLTADTENKTIVLTPSKGTAQVITVPYATDASTVNGHEVPELENGKIPANYLPSFVDNVDEYDSISLFPVVGESNRIYIDKSTNKTYRWSGTAYVEISESIALGETSSTAYRGDRGKIAYDHSQSAHAPSNAEANQNAFSNVKIDSDIINAGTTTDTLEFIAGDNIILTPNVSNKKITVSQVPVRKTASGNIASFSDGTGDPFLKVKANINPVQDLHGYDYPWVGGAGKNKFDATLMTNPTANVQWLQMTLSANTQYTISSSIPYSATSAYIFCIGGTDTSSATSANSGVGLNTPRTVTSDNNGIISVGYRNVGADGSLDLANYTYQIELGSTATTYEPYSNICPISGFTGVNVAVTGANIWDEEWEAGGISNTDGQNVEGSGYFRAKNYINVLPNTAYYIQKNSTDILGLRFYDRNKSYVSSSPVSINGAITIPNNVYYLRFVNASGDTYNNDISINYPSTDTSYHAYQGSITSIPFHDSSDNPITVYGGTLNVTSGELTVDRAYVDLGTLTWKYNASQFYQRFYSAELQAMVKKPASDDIIASATCSNYPLVPATTIYSGRDKAVSIGANGTLSVADSAYTDATAFKTAMNGVQLVYELATPQTYQLTPTQVSTLLGQNNIFADCGQIEVAYKTPFYTDLTTKNEVQVLINESITSALNASY